MTNIVNAPINTLREYYNNARVHSDEQIKLIAQSIAEFGFINPIIVDADNVVIAGHGRLLAARALGLKQCPTIRVETLSEEQVKAYRLLDNRLADMSVFDMDNVMSELENIQIQLDGIGFDSEFLGLLCNDKEQPDSVLVDISTLSPNFFISITGPLRQQASVIEKLKILMSDIKDIEVKIGNIDA